MKSMPAPSARRATLAVRPLCSLLTVLAALPSAAVELTWSQQGGSMQWGDGQLRLTNGKIIAGTEGARIRCPRGTFTPGGQPRGTFTQTGGTLGGPGSFGAALALTNSGWLVITGGTTTGEFFNANGATFVKVNGPTTLDGTLEVLLYGGFLPLPGQTFTVLNGTTVSGTFANISAGRVPVVNGGSFAVSVSGTAVTLSDYQTGAGAVQTYDQWRAQSGYFTAAEHLNDALSGPNADPDLDGLNNLLEFAMGTHPRQDSSASLPWLRTEAGNHIYTWQRSRTAAGVLSPEMSSALNAWGPITTTPVLVSETAQIQTWAVTLTPDEARRFLRVKFTP